MALKMLQEVVSPLVEKASVKDASLKQPMIDVVIHIHLGITWLNLVTWWWSLTHIPLLTKPFSSSMAWDLQATFKSLESQHFSDFSGVLPSPQRYWRSVCLTHNHFPRRKNNVAGADLLCAFCHLALLLDCAKAAVLLSNWPAWCTLKPWVFRWLMLVYKGDTNVANQ